MPGFWTARDLPQRLPLRQGQRHDVVIVGAGITGLMTALLLARAGRDVAVVEAGTVGSGTTVHTTGKVSVLHGVRGQQIARRQSVGKLRAYLEANRAAQQWLSDYCAVRAVAVQRRDAFTYARTRAEIPAVEAEYEALGSAGLPVEWHDELATPFPGFAAVGLADQLQLDPMSLVNALAADIEAHGAPIYESTRVLSVDRRRGGHLVRTDRGEIRARTVVSATGTPILDRGGFFARLTAQRSYLVAFRTSQPPPRQMFLSAGTPSRSLREVPTPDGELLLVGGNGHPVGRAEDTARFVADLTAWTQRWFPGAEPVTHWSAQDYHPVGELPYAGPILPGHDHILLATGYAKWGLTNGTAAALALAGHITGEPVEWAHSFAAWGPPARATIRAAASANTTVLTELASGWVRASVSDGSDDPPAEGRGRVRRHGVHPVATATIDGVTTHVSAICPHLYGIVRWNDADKSWDCPLHGSRFAADGTLLEGPATSSLPAAGPTTTPLP